ncbi:MULTISPECIES: DUF6143 family protein [Cytobacillus]|uniref:DUF6143 family protein n=1 Tax=Cytobacillus firmus TaxID=1399 RepID=A0AA46P8Y7_CYTFI|nr:MULTISPECIES: DUF6143 family protein [Cytobacillus]KML44412.1 hypothetical protein VL14_04135 [Cytobacillus firmus]MCC3646815.1 hypothetical protein [Cytobacillus oceanisediminis]UYG95386.1 DUF6143 family protein [Cytobacillus firmus]
MSSKKGNGGQGRFIQAVDIPQELYQSLKGKYFIGYADELSFGRGTSAWARLYNPPNSGVNLHVNVWTVTDVSDSTFRAQFWFNADPPGTPIESELVTPANTAITPLPKPKIKLQYATNVVGEPTGGIKAFVRRGQPETTLVDTENGKFIFPPGGSFLVFLSNPETPRTATSGRIAFGWWEAKI